MAFSVPPASPYRESHPAKPIQGDDEEYVDYLGRTADHWITNPPPAPAGFELVECSANPRHWPEYSPIDEDLYSGGCSRCIIADQAEVLRAWQCKAEHRRWKGWKITRWLNGKAYVLGIIASCGSSYGGCEKHPVQHNVGRWRGRRNYILGVSVEWWRCLLKYHHIRGEHVGFGFCGKCVPCPTCGTFKRHDWGCPEEVA